jgi:phosphoserine phosphatase
LLKIKVISNYEFKNWYSKFILRNQNTNYLNSCVKKFIHSLYFQKSLNRDVIDFIEIYNDFDKIIISATFSFLVEEVAKYLKFETSLSLNIEIKRGKYTGLIIGKLPYGKEKVSVYKNFISNKTFNKSLGIGDSISDLPILELLDEAYMVKFDKKTGVTTFSKVDKA